MNKAILMGRLAADPELRRTPNDIAVISFTIAISRPFSKDGVQQTDWIDCVAWRQTAEFISRYFNKGKMIMIEGSIQTRTYEDKTGNKRKAVEVLVDRCEFCGDGNRNNTNASGGFSGAYGSPSTADPMQGMSASFESGSDDDFATISSDDDLPF